MLYRLGKIWLANAQPAKAETLWQQILTAYPATGMAGMAQVQLARLYEARGDLPNAVAMYEAFLARPETAPQFKLQAYVHLFRLKQALGDPISANVNLETARQLALQSNDAELQLNLAQYLLRRGDRAGGGTGKTVARELLEQGIKNAEAVIRAEKDPQKKVWWVYLIARRLDNFGEYARLAERFLSVQPQLLQNPVLDVQTRFSLSCLGIRALEVTSRPAETEAQTLKLLQLLPEDSDRLGHVYYRLAQQARKRGDAVAVRQLAVEAYREVPTTHITQLMYLQTAVEDFNAGRFSDALAKAAELEKSVAVTGLRPWAEQFLWDCQYVRGRCRKAQGNIADGQRLVAEAVARKPVLPLVLRLTEPGSSTQ